MQCNIKYVVSDFLFIFMKFPQAAILLLLYFAVGRDGPYMDVR